MTVPVANSTPYLRTTRAWPQDPARLQLELTRGWTELAQVLNVRTIGLYNLIPTITGEQWFSTNPGQANPAQTRQSIRQVYQFSDSTLTFNHNIPTIFQMTNFYGQFYDGTYWQRLPYVDVVDVTNQIGVKVSATQVIITKGGGSPPTVSQGVFVIEWLP